jgi:hypothetical protein
MHSKSNNQKTGCKNLKTFWDKLITAAAMSNCAMGMTHFGESGEGFTRLQKQMDALDAPKGTKDSPKAP